MALISPKVCLYVLNSHGFRCHNDNDNDYDTVSTS